MRCVNCNNPHHLKANPGIRNWTYREDEKDPKSKLIDLPTEVSVRVCPYCTTEYIQFEKWADLTADTPDYEKARAQPIVPDGHYTRDPKTLDDVKRTPETDKMDLLDQLTQMSQDLGIDYELVEKSEDCDG
jgi:NMD protein affecting ribosome stability and mRNA decay